jgi:hypothetical protein
VGDGCVIEVKAAVAAGSSLANNCVVGVKCTTRMNEHVPNDTVIFGHDQDRRTQSKPSSAQMTLHERHLEYLNVLRKFHSLKVTYIYLKRLQTPHPHRCHPPWAFYCKPCVSPWNDLNRTAIDSPSANILRLRVNFCF